MKTAWLASLALIIALAPCGARGASNPFAGSWKNAGDDRGIVIYAAGPALFFSSRQLCPTFWATYSLRDPHTAIAIGIQSHERRVLSLDPDGTLHDSSTSFVYRRTGDEDAGIRFKESTAHSCGAAHTGA